ncbi:hypothetical protein NMY22_g13974 [Coprinellus aureogranulatus]|nr:hypothetical protein NMY22_g13974 [Coprinellus aureogranulatus]
MVLGRTPYRQLLQSIWALVGRSRFVPDASVHPWLVSLRGVSPQPVRWVNRKAPIVEDDLGDSARAQGKAFKYTTIRLSNLDPSNMTHKDIVDISGSLVFTRAVVDDSSSARGRASLYYKSVNKERAKGSAHLPFPPATRGVFYFHDRTDVHPTAGDIRFRVLPVGSAQGSDSDQDLFAKGHDLLDHNGLFPWHISLLSVIYTRRQAIYGPLKKLGCITEEAEEEVERLRESVRSNGTKGLNGLQGQVVDRFIDPFVLDLSRTMQPVIFLTKDGILPHEFFTLRLIHESRTGYSKLQCAYSGTVFVRFEMIEKGAKKRVVLRVLKFLKPPNSGDLAVQREGEFLRKWNFLKKVEQVWMAGPRTKWIPPSSLKLLEETYLPKSNA